MRFVAVPVGPYLGRDAIARAYLDQPPTDTMRVSDLVSAGETDTVRFVWSAGEGGGSCRLPGGRTSSTSWKLSLTAEVLHCVTLTLWPGMEVRATLRSAALDLLGIGLDEPTARLTDRLEDC
jgi:hypothetical protein